MVAIEGGGRSQPIRKSRSLFFDEVECLAGGSIAETPDFLDLDILS